MFTAYYFTKKYFPGAYFTPVSITATPDYVAPYIAIVQQVNTEVDVFDIETVPVAVDVATDYSIFDLTTKYDALDVDTTTVPLDSSTDVLVDMPPDYILLVSPTSPLSAIIIETETGGTVGSQVSSADVDRSEFGGVVTVQSTKTEVE